jgi:hypothetical protein
MSVVKVIELSSESTQGYDNAVRQAVERAARTIRNIRSVGVETSAPSGLKSSKPPPRTIRSPSTGSM